jgi:hypothetical protein
MSLVSVRTRGQRGGVLLIGAFLIAAIFSFGLLVVDLARIELAAEGLQRTADSAALAGAEFLQRNGALSVLPNLTVRESEWTFAKRAVLALVRSDDNPVFGGTSSRDTGDLGAGLSRDACLGDRDLTGDADLPCRIFDFPDITVQIERGYSFRKEPPGALPVYGDPRFVSLEGVYGPDGSGGLRWGTEGLDIPFQCAGESENNDAMVEPTTLANAVRVRLSLKEIPITMGALLRIFTGPTITREAVASVDLPVARGIPVDSSRCQ